MIFELISLPNFSPEINPAVDSVKNSTSEAISDINMRDAVSELVNALPPEVMNKIYLFFTIGTYVLVAIFVYIIVKIIRQIIAMKDSRNIRIIAENAKEINAKLGKKK